MLPLEGLEHFSLDGVRYEAFNTSGGLGTLCDTLAGKVRELNYKTVRYVGHRDLMKVLVDELRLGEHREQFKEILERAVPVTFQDVVVTFCTVTGWRKGLLVQKSDARKIYHQQIGDEIVECDPDHDGGRHLCRARFARGGPVAAARSWCGRNR